MIETFKKQFEKIFNESNMYNAQNLIIQSIIFSAETMKNVGVENSCIIGILMSLKHNNLLMNCFNINQRNIIKSSFTKIIKEYE